MTLSVSAPSVAYFSMEIGLEQAIPTFSGGLGVLAGDTLRSAADLSLPVVAISLLYRKGYFRQHLDPNGAQTEAPVQWEPEKVLAPVEARATVEIEGRTVHIQAWRKDIVGVTGHVVPVYFLDTALPENSEFDRTLTDVLYGGDSRYRLCQEVVLGMGGAAMLHALGLTNGDMQHHINEGHAALLCLALVERELDGRQSWEVNESDMQAVRSRCIFTTHTPVSAGHDRFARSLVEQVIGEERSSLLTAIGGWDDETLNMTQLALRFSHWANGVAKRHQQVSQDMFPRFDIHAVTNGVHAATWTAPSFQALFDRHLPGWREDNFLLRQAVVIPLDEVREAHTLAKYALLDEVKRRTGVALQPNVMTIGFARRSTTYKRADMVFTDIQRLRSIVRHVGPVQFVYAGKAHPQDGYGKEIIRHIFQAGQELGDDLTVVYLENYGMDLGALLTSGCDLWLNNPMRPLEASGTSGMKAALNGVPSLSVLDGWWIEGCFEGATGWSIGDDARLPQDPARDIEELYLKLERTVLPMFYGMPYAYASVMRNAIALNGSHFNTQRMVLEYVQNAYTRPAGVRGAVHRGVAAG